MKGRNDVQVSPIACPPFTIIALTNATAESAHTRQHAQMATDQQRRLGGFKQLFSYDILDEHSSSINPADTETMQALTFLHLRQLIRQGAVYHVPDRLGRWHVCLKPRATSSLLAIDTQRLSIFPLFWRYRLIRLIQTAPMLCHSGHHKEINDLTLNVHACDHCHLVFIGTHSCQNQPSPQQSSRLMLHIPYPIQRLFWLSRKLKNLAIGRLHHPPTPTFILIAEPRQPHQEISLLMSLLDESGKRPLFHEICIWPSRQNKTLPAPGRTRFISKLERKWQAINHFASLKNTIAAQSPHTDRQQTIIDHWLLHTLNQTVGMVLKCEENHQPDQALKQLHRFISHRLSKNYILWRKTSWDSKAQHTLLVVIETIRILLVPYKINREALQFDHADILKKNSQIIEPFKSDWVFAREFKWIEIIRKVALQLSTLRRTLQMAGLTPDTKLFIISDTIRRFPLDFIVLLQKITSISQIELLTQRQSKGFSGLSGEIGIWKIILPIQDEQSRHLYRQHLQTQLDKESREFNTQKEAYLQQKSSPGTSQATLVTMRKKLLSLKSKQMVTMKRYHDIS